MHYVKSRYIGLVAVSLLIGLSLSPLSWISAAPPATAAFQRTWDRTDKPVADLSVSRTWMWAPEAFTGAMTETYAEAPGSSRTVQYFDKSRMEDNSYRALDPWDVTNGLLVVELMTGDLQTGDNSFETRQPATVNVGGDADDPTGPTYATMALVRSAPPLNDGEVIARVIDRDGNVSNAPQSVVDLGVTAGTYAPETKHRVASVFWSFMTSSGLVWENGQLSTDWLFLNPFYATGFPVTEAYWTNIKVAGNYQWVLSQCFERRCLTYTPENPDGWQVEAGNVGLHYYKWRYGSLPWEPGPTPTATIPLPPSPTATSTATIPPPPTHYETIAVVTAPSGPDVETTAYWEPVPDMSTNLVTTADGSLAITFTAEASASGGYVWVRALVDGQVANPSDVNFATATWIGTNAFTFVAENVPAGSHSISLEWGVDSGQTGYLGDRSMSVVAVPPDLAQGNLATRWAHGPWLDTTVASWAPIPDMSTSIETPAGSQLTITLSAEALSSSNTGRIWVRAVIDGQPAYPADVVFAQGGYTGTHTFTFTGGQLMQAGSHSVQMEWLGEAGFTSSIRDRTLSVVASPTDLSQGGLIATAQESGWVSESSTSWVALPGLAVNINTPSGGPIAISFSAEASTTNPGARMFVRALVDGQPASPSDVVYAIDGPHGTVGFTFSVANVTPGSHSVHLEWLAESGQWSSVADRTLVVYGWPGT
jgi:hypothetical protein